MKTSIALILATVLVLFIDPVSSQLPFFLRGKTDEKPATNVLEIQLDAKAIGARRSEEVPVSSDKSDSDRGVT